MITIKRKPTCFNRGMNLINFKVNKLKPLQFLKEESDIISKNGLEPKDIGKYVSEIARNYFFEQEKL